MSTVLKDYIVNREHHQFCRDFKEYANLSEEYKKLGLCPKERMTRKFELLSSLETPVLLPEEKICLSTVEEYIQKVDYPSEICRIIKEMQKEKDVISAYKEQILRLEDSKLIG